jgi:hypothetical protein
VIASWARRLLALPLASAVVVAMTVAQCGVNQVDAVTGPEAGGGWWSHDASTSGWMPESGPIDDAGNRGPTFDGGQPYTLSGFTNSDPAIVRSHDTIAVMQPRVLLLDFCNDMDKQAVFDRAQAVAIVIGESSRYHGYADGTAQGFLDYRLYSPLVDLTDPEDAGADAGKIPLRDAGRFGGPGGFHGNNPAHCTSSSKLPVDAKGEFDATGLFTQMFAANYGFPDPLNPSRFLTLCELFEQGVINELWLEASDDFGVRSRPPLLIESRQMYDDNLDPIPGMFTGQTGESPFPANVQCKVTARIAFVSPNSAAVCDVAGYSVGLEKLPMAIPYMDHNATDFFNENLNIPYQSKILSSWDQLVEFGNNKFVNNRGGGWCMSQSTPCIGYGDGFAQATFPDGTLWKVAPFPQGCGTANFPPNARWEFDWANATAVPSRCENYAMHNGPGGSDMNDSYSSNKPSVAAYQQRFGGGSDCGAGWQVYYRQNMPGYGAHDVNGAPIKNWWPFLFY